MARYGTKPALPVINLKDPITRGLAFDEPFFRKGGPPTELFRATGTITGAAYNMKNGFPALNFSSSGHKVDYVTNDRQNAVKSLTIEALVFPNTAAQSTQILLKGVAARYFVLQTDSGQATFGYSGGFSGSNGGFGGPNGKMVASVWNHVFVTVTNVTSPSSRPSFFINGVRYTSGQNSFNVDGSGTVNTDDGVARIGNNAASSSNFNGHVALIRYWRRVLSDSEMRSLDANPWRIYTPGSFPIGKSIAAAPSTGTNQYFSMLGVG